MKQLLLIILLGTLITSVPSFAQIELSQDTLTRPSKTNNIRLSFPSDKKLRIVPKTGNTIQIPLITDLNVKAGNFTINQLRSVNLATAKHRTVIVTDKGIGGVFKLDSLDTTSPDDSLFTIVNTSGLRYKRETSGLPVSLEIVGAVSMPFTSTLSQSTAIRTANLVALNKAAKYGRSWFVPEGIIEINGKWKVDNKPFELKGTWRNSIIRQTVDDSLLVIDNTKGLYNPIIEGVTFQANGIFNVGGAITILGYATQNNPDYLNSQPSALISKNIIVGSNFWKAGSPSNNKFKFGIRVTTPTQITIENNLILGASGNSDDGSRGIHLSTTKSATVVMIRNNQIFQWGKGIYIYGKTSLAIEGVNIDYNTVVTCYDNIDIDNNGGPGWTITNNHLAASRVNIKLGNTVQGVVTGNLMYNFGNSVTNDFASFIQGSLSSDLTVHDNRMYDQSGTVTNHAYGILVAGSSTNISVGWNIHDNYIALKSGTTNPAVWLQGFAQANTVRHNEFVGTSVQVQQTLPYNTIRDNFPLESADGYFEGVLTTASDGVNKKLDLFWARSSYVTIPSSQTGVITEIEAPFGREFTIRTDGVVTFKHDLSKIRTLSNSDVVTDANTLIAFIKTPQRVEQTRLANKDVFLIKNGFSIQSGNGSTTAFTISHGLGVIPDFIDVTAGSSDAKNISYITRDVTNITINYAIAPPSGSSNLTFYWSAKK